MQSIFHPAYAINHQQAAINLNQPHAAVFKGEGGEVERRPEATCQALYVHNGVASEAQWPKMVEGRQEYADMNDIALLKAVWRGQQRNGYGEQAVIGTLAILQLLLQRCESPEAATELAHQCWEQRNRDRI